jgi:hypothetical protein
MTEVAWHDADNGVVVSVHDDLASDDVAGAAEQTAPQTITDHHRVRESGNGVVRSVDASELRRGAEQLKVVGARDQHLNPLGTITAEKRRADWPQCGDAFEDPCPFAKVEELGL